VIIAGITETTPGALFDFWVAKFNGSTGAAIWQRQYDSDGCEDSAAGIAIDSQGNIGVVGKSYGPGTFLGLFKLNGANGDIMWQRRVVNANIQANEDIEFATAWVNGDLYSSDICVDTNDDFYFNLTGIYCSPYATVAGIHKISSSGEWKWSKVISYAGYLNGASSLICDSDNNVYLNSTIINNNFDINTNSDQYHFAQVITKFNASGRKLWSKSLAREQSEVWGTFGWQGAYGIGQSIAVNDDYILICGAAYQNSAYSQENSQWFWYPYLAQLDKSGTDFVKDGWIYKDNKFKIFDMSASLDDAGFLLDLTASTADIVVTNGDVTVGQFNSPVSLSYINVSRVKTMTLDGARLHLPENGGLALSRKHIGHYTSIGKFDLDGFEGNNTGGDTWINGVTGDAAGNVYAAGGWYTNDQWNDGQSEVEVPLIWKIDSEGAIVWTAGNNLDQWGADMIDVAYNAATDTIVALGHDNDNSLENFDGAEGFNLFTLDAGSGKLKNLRHIRDTGVNPNGGGSGAADMTPFAVALQSNGRPVVVGYINDNYDEFTNVTSGAAGLSGSNEGILVINKSVFNRGDSTLDIEYPNGLGYWYVGGSAILYVNRYASVASVTITGTGVDATFTVVANPATNAYSVTASGLGTGYAQGDTVKVLGSLLGGVDATNDALITVTAVGVNGAVDTITATGTGQTTKIKLDVDTGTDFTQAGTYNVWHETDSDAFIWTPDWHTSVGGEDTYDTLHCVAIDKDDNIVVGGASGNLNLPANTTQWGDSSQSAFIAKYNEAGVRQWAKAVDGHEGNNSVWGVTTDSEGNVYGVMSPGPFSYNPQVIKLDSNGGLVWLAQLSYYTNWSSTWSIAIDSDENIIISGQVESGRTNNDRVGYNSNIHIAKFDRDGNPLYHRLLWSNNGMYTGYNDWYGNNLAVVGDKFVWGGVASAWNNLSDDIAVIAQLPLDGTGLGNNGNYYYDKIEITVERWTENDTFGNGILIVRDVADRLPSRSHALIDEPYPTGQPGDDGAFAGSPGPMTIYADIDGKVAHILEEGGADITGVKEIVFEDGTRQSTTAQDIPQVDISLTNRGDDDYWLRLEDRGHHIYMDGHEGVNIVIPSALAVPFPVGTTIVIVTDNNSQTVYSDNNNDYMINAGADGDGSYAWIIPRYSMVTLLKIRQGYNSDGTPTNSCDWMIAGPGLTGP
jgi:hypothetical protein